MFSWHHGHEVAALACEEKQDQEDQEGADAPEETKKTDADLLKEDVIKVNNNPIAMSSVFIQSCADVVRVKTYASIIKVVTRGRYIGGC